MNISLSSPQEDVIILEKMPAAEYKIKLQEGAENARHMDVCEHQDTCSRCIQYKKEGYEKDWKTGLHYSPYERRVRGAKSFELIA